MFKCLSKLENDLLNHWEIYSKKTYPIIYFANEICNIILIHQTMIECNTKKITLEESLALVIQELNMQPYLIDKKTKETLEIPSDVLKKEISLFEEWVSSKRDASKWCLYANLGRDSSVLQYRIGPDFIDVVFYGSENFYYHYSYALTSILVTENLKHFATQGIGLGRHTRNIGKGMFEKHLIQIER